jgi:predicted HAD superfamily phosphohydrolase YqeG
MPMNYFVDVDDTLIRTVGTKIIPLPATIAWIRSLDLSDHKIYLWSRGGSEYARTVADRLGIASMVTAFLPKPDVLIDDQVISEWTHLRQWHPNQLGVDGAR